METSKEGVLKAFRDKGHEVSENFVVEETISGAVCKMERKGFRTPVENKLMEGNTLLVLKLDRLGRDSIGVQKTTQLVGDKDINVHSLDLPTRDLSTSEDKLILRMFTAFAELERDRIRERTIEGPWKVRSL